MPPADDEGPVRFATDTNTAPVPATRSDALQGTCTQCSAPAQAGARFCGECGFHLAAPEAGRLASAKRRLAGALFDEVVKDGSAIGSLFWPAILPPGTARTVLAILGGAYWISTLFLWTQGQTPAKRFLKMTVVTEDGEPAGFFRMAFRETIGKMISLLVFGLGFLSVPLDREKRGWHDKLFETWVVVDDEL